MITRALLIALSCTLCSTSTPLGSVADDNCALYLNGPGRSSAYDYRLNLLRGNFGYDGQNTCITYDAVNQAYIDARKRIVVAQPKGDWKPEDYASVGELILDISINLARTYGLSYEEIEKGLPLIDTSRTLIREVCPPVFSHVECRAGKYRRLDGLCNNVENPTWGSTNAPFQRLIGPLFSDGINSPRISHTGRDLPLSRVVSRTMHPDDGLHEHAGTVMIIAWGQFMDHDYTLTGTPLDPINRNDPEECCKRPPHLKHPYCNEIRVPDDDYFYRLFGVKCIDFVRAFPSPRPGCKLGSRVPFNTLTGVIDGNTVYGVTDKFARKLRTGYGGLLRMNPVFKEYGLRDLLPLKLDIPDEGCTRPNKNMYCFEAGEIRVNEQLVLTVMHTLMAREHNRIANALAEVNPHWDDETLYQEARNINIAEIQHVTYNEFLPILLGKDVMEKFGLVLEKEGYWDGYDPTVNPDVIDAFASAAYRFGHTLLPTAVERWSKAHKFIASKRLSDLIRRPYDLYRAGVLDEYVMGLMNQVAQAMDDSITQEVTNHLFKKVGQRFGHDLVSFNMQRGREFGIPGYMDFRKFCGLPDARNFDDLTGTMPNVTVRKYETIYEHPIDVDLWSAGVSEKPLPGSMLGPTFACIIATQFSYSKRGDRFWFELPNQPSSFTPEQLVEIRKSRLARIICDNTDIIDTVQLYPFVLPDHELNPRVPCRSAIMPSMDFSKWAEPQPFHGNAKEFITKANITEKIYKDLDNATISNDTIKSNNTTEGRHGDHEKSINIQDFDKKLTETISNKSYLVNSKNSLENPKKQTSGSFNNLKRRKRSDGSLTSGNSPLIVNYETNHPPHTFNSPDFLSSYSIDSKLPRRATFDIETNHEIPVTFKEVSDEDKIVKNEVSDIKSENNENSKENEDSSQNSDSRSKENEDNILNSDSSSKENEDSNQNFDSSSKENLAKPESSGVRLENDENSKENEDSNQNSDSSSKENLEKPENLDIRSKNSENSKENENSKQNSDSSSSENLSDNNDDTKNINASLENYETSKSEEDINKGSLKNTSDKIYKDSSEDSTAIAENSSENLKESDGQSNIDDDEIKPVVEINNESESEEHFENKKLSADLKSNKSGNDENAKQQFERIPLNYNHDDDDQKQLDEPASSSKSNKPNIDKDYPKPKFDKKYNINFNEPGISLPDIILPDDILAYSRPYNKKKEKKNSFFIYDDNNDDSEKNSEKLEEEEDSSQNSKEIKNEENEDLYEKFVKERFGRKNPLKKRSESYKNFPDITLINAVKKLVQKTKTNDDLIKESGDPNAQHAWTLEYGQNLR